MIKSKVQVFRDERSGEYFQGGILFTEGERSLLFEREGHCLLLSTELAEELKQKQIAKEIESALASRGFLYPLEHKKLCCNKKIYPEFFMIDMTDRCNMKCKYCLRDVQKNGTSISKQTLKDICKYIENYCNKEQLKDVSVQAWGGEPLLELESILNLRKWIQPKNTRVHISIETNALLLTTQTIEQLYDHKIGIGISIDGNKVCHDKQRIFVSGKPTFDIVSENLKKALKRYGKYLGTITTITKLNYNYIEDILDYFSKELHLTNVKFNFVHQSSFVGCEHLCLSDEEIVETTLRMFRKLVNLTEEGYPIVEKNIKTKINNLLFNEYTDICLSKGCCGGRKMIVFDKQGNIFPCELTDFFEQSIGSIYDKENDLISIVKKAVKKRSYFMPKCNTECVECEWYCYCRGGCTVRILNSGSKPPDIDKIECAINKVLYPEIVKTILTKPVIINEILGGNRLLL